MTRHGTKACGQDYDYLIVLDHYPAVDAFVQAHFPDQADRQVIALHEK